MPLLKGARPIPGIFTRENTLRIRRSRYSQFIFWHLKTEHCGVASVNSWKTFMMYPIRFAIVNPIGYERFLSQSSPVMRSSFSGRITRAYASKETVGETHESNFAHKRVYALRQFC